MTDTTDDALFGGGGVDMPTKAAENVTRTAVPAEQLSEQAKKNRRRRSGGTDLSELKLATPGLLGVPMGDL